MLSFIQFAELILAEANHIVEVPKAKPVVTVLHTAMAVVLKRRNMSPLSMRI